MKTKILFVCLGNICRSPAAEAVFSKIIHDEQIQNRFEIDSAGTGGWHVGKPADSRMREIARQKGINITSIARQISLSDFHHFDLILTMDDQNYSDVKSLSDGLEIPVKSIVRPIMTYSLESKYTQVPDPYYGGKNGFEKVIDLLDDACHGIIKELN